MTEKVNRNAVRAMLCWLFAACIIVLSLQPSCAEVSVLPLNTVFDQGLIVRGWSYESLGYALTEGTTIRVDVQVGGGLNNAVQVWLVDLQNLQLLRAGVQFNYFQSASPRIARNGSFTFTAPATNNYFVVFDNRTAFFTRNLAVRVDQVGGPPNAWSSAMSAMYAARYSALKSFFVFRDFDISVRPCGVVNAFSDPNITICTELLEDVQRRNVPGGEEFFFYHEVGHSLLNVWGDPNYDNEDTADEFATAMMMLMGRQDVALQAAQWFADHNSMAEAAATQIQDNPHSLSIQRARNIIKWLNQRDDRLSRWFRLMIPHLTDTALAQIIDRSANQAWASDQVNSLLRALKDEQEKRQSMVIASP